MKTSIQGLCLVATACAVAACSSAEDVSVEREPGIEETAEVDPEAVPIEGEVLLSTKFSETHSLEIREVMPGLVSVTETMHGDMDTGTGIELRDRPLVDIYRDVAAYQGETPDAQVLARLQQADENVAEMQRMMEEAGVEYENEPIEEPLVRGEQIVPKCHGGYTGGLSLNTDEEVFTTGTHPLYNDSVFQGGCLGTSPNADQCIVSQVSTIAINRHSGKFDMLGFNQSFDGAAKFYLAWESDGNFWGHKSRSILVNADLNPRFVAKVFFTGGGGTYESRLEPSSSCPRVSGGYWF